MVVLDVQNDVHKGHKCTHEEKTSAIFNGPIVARAYSMQL